MKEELVRGGVAVKDDTEEGHSRREGETETIVGEDELEVQREW